jgi:TPP-dependent pyruvate/acetoin dehydrogenase alpha subunit
MIEAKLMRMKGHAMHDPAHYVPPEVLEFWKRRDPIVRMERYMKETGWMTENQIAEMHAEVQRFIDAERAIAEAAPMPAPEEAGTDVYCDNALDIPVKYGEVRVKQANEQRKLGESSAPGHYK